jgi:hypothetical protein
MQIQIGIAGVTLNRKGRKRKSGRRTASGQLTRKPLDYRAMAGEQPHRNWLPVGLRTDERAGTVLGCLNLLNRISEHEYEAGRRYSVIVGAYLAMANAPRGTAGAGRGYDCSGEQNCSETRQLVGRTCTCLDRTERFNRAYEAISRDGGRPAHIAVNWVAIQDRVCAPEHLKTLKLGLTALAGHFGLTNSGNRRL